MTFIYRCGLVHSTIVVQTCLTCQYLTQAINILTKRPMLNIDTITHIKILRLGNLLFSQLILSSLFLCFDEALNFPM